MILFREKYEIFCVTFIFIMLKNNLKVKCEVGKKLWDANDGTYLAGFIIKYCTGCDPSLYEDTYRWRVGGRGQ